MSEEENKYLIEYYKNEYDANRQMSIANIFAGGLLFIIWLLFVTRVFPLHEINYLLTSIILPIDVLILVSPAIYLKSQSIKKPGYKYFLIFTFMLAIGILNILLPKHGLLGWATVLFLVNHYYNPKLGKITFAITIVSLLICMYLGMLLGEYDPNLLSDGIINGEIVYPVVDGKYVLPDSPQERFEFLHKLLLLGENRYLKVFIYYFLSRAVLLTLIFFVSNALNKRTYNLLVNEIKVNSEQEKTNTELEVAKEIQLATLPSEFVTSKDIEILGELKAAKEIGGDFYDYINIDEDHVAIVVGDVSGKGIPAAMFMMKTITCFKNFITINKTPAQILKEVSASIYQGNNSQMFVTCFLAILDKKTGKLSFANAGHNPPIIGHNRHYRFLKCMTGFVLGGLKEAYVVDEEIYLEKGDSLTIYTDGVTEARNSEGQFFGEGRLINAFNKKDYTCLVELHHTIKDNVENFVKDAPQSDDITFITIKYHGDNYSYSEHSFEGYKKEIPNMLKFVEEYCKEHHFSEQFSNKLQVVVDEITSNIVNYGYQDQGGPVFFRLLYNEDQKEFVLTVIDKAPEFNPLEVNGKAISGDIKNQKEGGLGIFIVKNIMSEYAYDYINGKNILVLRKKF